MGGINEKPFIPLSFTLGAAGSGTARLLFETAGAQCIYVASGAGITPGAISLQIDENEPFPVAVGAFFRVPPFDRLRVINNLGVTVSGSVYVAAYADFLAMFFPMGI